MIKNRYCKFIFGQKSRNKTRVKIDIYKPQFVIDPLSQKEKIKNKKVAEAVISNLVEGDSAWGVIKDEEQAKNISIGDIVKVRY